MERALAPLHTHRAEPLNQRRLANLPIVTSFFVLQNSHINRTASWIWPRLMTDGSVPKQKPRKKSKLSNSAVGPVFKGGECTRLTPNARPSNLFLAISATGIRLASLYSACAPGRRMWPIGADGSGPLADQICGREL